jgi:isopentenyl-diphosphate delta-isomerase
MQTQEQVILVDALDNEMGSMEKMEVHLKGLLHRAFSVFLFNNQGEMLLQKRAMDKYHSPGLWTNTCCSHPRPGELVKDAANRRLAEEMGIAADIEHAFHFIYEAKLDQGLVEHELDHVYIGTYDGIINPNEQEVSDYLYINMEVLKNKIMSTPDDFTAWFKIAFPKVEAWYDLKFVNA